MSFILTGWISLQSKGLSRVFSNTTVQKHQFFRPQLSLSSNSHIHMGFPCGSAGKESACSVGDLGLTPGLGRSLGEGNGYPCQYPGLENSVDCIVHGVAKSQTQLNELYCLSQPYMTTGKTIALTRWIFIGKVTSLLFSTPSRLVIAFLPRSKHLLVSWLQSPSAVILETEKIKLLTVSIVSHPFAMK